ncbi:outer membrane receptor for ferrienterochelin and colicin [Dyadobacter jejuensis]|uniref:Outer membrane receptor for ferrienterochelin and colicin n=1 Tax=Dyadobacter jejuensis TaxID=1082580 RepID=A0A316AWJ6_9BACT|nr:TonB-dependent receptor [Dyadobacter jejuensis]PWJ54537.1 outer membrane receptor for ferrienterochelin and colicin [Dyadobacter jejuensis]
MPLIYLILLFLLFPITAKAQERITVSGFVREKGSEELLPGVNVYLEHSTYGTVANSYGFYSITIPKGTQGSMIYSFVGYKRQTRPIVANTDLQIDLTLEPDNQLEEVTVSGNRQQQKVSEAAQMSQIDIPISQVKKLPAFFGEKDVIKVLQLMPGVQKGTEGQTGLYVRGGGPDQNLIILDDAVVYNANHLFGFFSIFNSDALKSVELTKGGFPARYGGRLSSVVELNMKEGSKDKLHGEGGIGLISSRLTLEGPLANKKASFLLSGRRTYIDFLAQPLIAQQQKGENSKIRPGYYFYDLNAKVNYDFGAKNKLYLSGYFGQDKFSVKETAPDEQRSSGLDWGNATATLRWNHLINQKLFLNTSLIYSHFNFGVSASENILNPSPPNDEFKLGYNSLIRDFSLKSDFDYFPNTRHSIKFGWQVTAHRFVPSALAIHGTNLPDDLNFKAKTINNFESGVYVEDTWQPTQALKMNLGFRLSTFQTENKTYLRPEPRFSAAYRLADDFSLKGSFALMNQYVHLLSNTGLGLPTDLWVPTTDRVAPQQSSQVALGLAKDLEKPGLAITLEGYYKNMDRILSYKEGSSFLSIDGQNANEINWEDNITAGQGWSYGAELLLQKKTGRLSGWIGYTLSWTQWKFPELNFGKTYFPRYDRRHDISVVGIYELSKRITLSATWVYGTGNALSIPVSTYYTFGDRFDLNPDSKPSPNETTEYGSKNSFRAEPYHRLDVAVQFHKVKKRHERTWEIGLYNAYNRRNPFFYDIRKKDNANGTGESAVLSRYSLFPIIPSISYNFKF